MSKGLNHTFSICAYKESPFLEDCIKSLLRQSVKSNIILCTSTPNDLIKSLANKYQITLHVNPNSGQGIAADWNFAYNCAVTDMVTVAHQDDIYCKGYTKALAHFTKKYDDWSLFFTDYTPIKNGDTSKRDANSIIRRILRIPVKNTSKSHEKWRKKAILMFGNSVVCPLITYNKKRLGDTIFTSKLSYNLDWDTCLKYANDNSRFLYADKVLGYFRVHDGATSKEFIDNSARIADDIYMFEQFWPKWFVKLLMIFYKLAYKTYE